MCRGELEPVRIALIEPELQIIRGADGGIRFGLGQGAGIAIGGGGSDGRSDERAAQEDGGLDAASRILDGFVGDGAPIPAFARLVEIAIVGANVVYDDRLGDGGWRTSDATLRLQRRAGGARAVMEVDARGDAAAGTAPGGVFRIVADRAKGAGRTDITARFGRVAASDLARQSRQLDWLRLIGGTVEGEAGATLEADGRLSRLDGVVVAEGGEIRGLGQPIPFDMAQLRFRVDPARERLTIEDFRLSAAAVGASLTGYADLDRGADGGLDGLAGQFDIGMLHLDLPDVFADPVDFDDGRLTARWSLDDERIEIVGGRLIRDDLAFSVEGRARASEDGWITDLRAEAEGMTVDDLVAFWPLAAASNARVWIDENIPVAEIDRLTAQMRIGRGDPQVALDFDFSGLGARYVEAMSPIEAATGTGHVSFDALFLTVDAGHVEPGPAGRIEIGGSSMVIDGFWADVPPARIALKTEGPVDAVLALMNQPPLRLISKLGRDLGGVGGAAQVEADLVVPLLARLKVEDVHVAAQAVLTDVTMPFALEPGRILAVRADRLELAADTDALRLLGDARIEGVPIAVEWNEHYGGGEDGRELALSGAVTPALLAAAGAGDLPIDGAPRVDLELRQSGGGPLAFTLDADLEPVRLEIAALDWAKEAGVPARLHAEGTRDDGLDIGALSFESPALDAEGALRMTADGGLERAEFGQVRMAGLGDFAATAVMAPDGVLDLRLTGRRLDLSDKLESTGAGEGAGDPAGAGAGGGPDPVRLSFDLSELRLSDRVALRPATGQVARAADGRLSGRIEGRLGPRAPVAVNLDIPAAAPGSVTVTSPDAGEALNAAGLYSGAQGGKLTVDVRTGTPESPGLSGQARIEDVVVFSESTFRDVLRDGGLAEAEAEVSSGGLNFRKVWVPFTLRDDLLTVTDAIAASPALAIKLNGTINNATDSIDLVGVLSPAYVLTGALNEIPLLGEILGGEGEGILAMTFRVLGDIDDPQFSVNPLSVLAPGILRRIFTQPSSSTPADFRDRINRQAR